MRSRKRLAAVEVESSPRITNRSAWSPSWLEKKVPRQNAITSKIISANKTEVEFWSEAEEEREAVRMVLGRGTRRGQVPY